MSVYFNQKNKTWRYDLTINGKRYTGSGYKTKRLAKQEEVKRREEVLNPTNQEETTDITFLELVNLRLDHIKAYNSEKHYIEYWYLARRWAERWGDEYCSNMTQQMIVKFLMERKKVSAFTANKEIRYLKAMFNFGVKKKYIDNNPLKELEFFPVEKRLKYIPSPKDIELVIDQADEETKDYLIAVRETMGRISEINRLTWDDVDFELKTLTLYTRKKKGGHLTPRKIPMTARLTQTLKTRFDNKLEGIPWVFWHRYYSQKRNEWIIGPFKDRKKIMKTLCEKAGVRYFRFHALRHSGASVLDNYNVPIGSIQRILGRENRTTTEIYLHTVGESERRAMEIFENAI